MKKNYVLRGAITGFVLFIILFLASLFIPLTICPALHLSPICDSSGHCAPLDSSHSKCPLYGFDAFSYNLSSLSGNSLTFIFVSFIILISLGGLMGWFYGKYKK